MRTHANGLRQSYHPLITTRADARVPLAIRYPGVDEERIEYPVSLVDLLPTVLDALGLTIPSGLDGESLLSSQTPRDVFVEASNFPGTIQRRAMIRGISKFVVSLRVKTGRV